MFGSSGRNVKPKSTNPFDDDVDDKVKSKSLNPFDEDDKDVKDEEFLQRFCSRYSNTGRKVSNSMTHFQPLNRESLSAGDRMQQLHLERQQKEERILEASRRTREILHETETIGISTAEDLVRQREQLERVNSRTEETNNTLKQSERHIQGIKSVFSSITNYLFKSKTPEKIPAKSPTPLPKCNSSNLTNIVEKSTQLDKTQPHPALRLRGLEYDSNYKTSSNLDEKLKDDLDDISLSLTRLKGLAQGMGTELDDQNSLLDRLNVSVDKADWKIKHQNKEMNSILSK